MSIQHCDLRVLLNGIRSTQRMRGMKEIFYFTMHLGNERKQNTNSEGFPL